MNDLQLRAYGVHKQTFQRENYLMFLALNFRLYVTVLSIPTISYFANVGITYCKVFS